VAVSVLLYHGTPESARTGWDVPIDLFRRQVDALLERGTRFIRFGDVNRPEYLTRGRYVAITFDDGQSNNIAAVEHLARHGIRATCFITRDWALTGRGENPWSESLTASSLKALDPICDFGSHGETHTPFTRLSAGALQRELRTSRDFLEQTLGRAVTAIALPCGAGSASVFEMCRIAGYDLVATTEPGPHIKHGLTVKRIGIARDCSAAGPARLAHASAFYWKARSARRSLLQLVAR
jgi:peptidoglycan/xylan/chitin deacetylase (PgdA/CDA1 family)